MNQKRKQAAALSYKKEQESAPIVSAKGKGVVADNIIKKAKENNVPIIEDASLVELLSEININETIPPTLYEVVAEVFAFIYQIDDKVKHKKTLNDDF